MNTHFHYVAMVVAGFVMLFGAHLHAVAADRGCGGMGMMGGGHDQSQKNKDPGHLLTHLLRHGKEIGLTSEQIGTLKTMQLDLSRAQARAEADIKVAKLELDALADDEQADATAIQAKVNQIKKAEGALLFTTIQSRRDALALLTPEQREKDDALRQEMMEKMTEGDDQHSGGMGGMRGGGRMGRGQAGRRGGSATPGGDAAGPTGGSEHQH